jgi:hypothetical protein
MVISADTHWCAAALYWSRAQIGNLNWWFSGVQNVLILDIGASRIFNEILSLYSQHIFSISIFVIKNEHLFYTNNQIHSIRIRFKTNLHPPTPNLTEFQKGVYYTTIKIFNNLPHNIRDLANEIVLFRNALKRFLLINSFYNTYLLTPWCRVLLVKLTGLQPVKKFPS